MSAPKMQLQNFLNQNLHIDDLASAGEEILAISRDLESGVTNNRLEEHKFVEVFLPLFDGTPPTERKYQVELGNWATVAGNVFREVDVVDTSGAVLFTVPPIVDRMAVSPNKGESRAGGVMDMVITMQRLQRNNPKQARHFLDMQLAGRADAMFNPANVLRFLRTWNAIFVRYGRPPILAIPGDNAAEQTTAEQSTGLPTTSDEDGWELA